MNDLIQSIGIIATLLIAIWQMRINSRQANAASDLNLMLKFDESTRVFMDTPRLWRLIDRTYEHDSADAEQEKMACAIFMVFNTFELAYRHYKKFSVMHADDWDDWERLVDAYAGKKYVWGWWRANKHEYGARFQAYVDERVAILGPRAQ